MLTIGIPTYNRKKQLIETLQFLERQTNDNFKIVIIDNSSSYDVKKSIEEQFDKSFLKKIELFIRPVNVGGDNNIVGLFEKVDNGWLWMVGDDDIEYEDSVDKIYKYIYENPNSAVIHFIERDYIKPCTFCSLESYVETIYGSINKKNAELIWGDFANICNKVYNIHAIRSCLDKVYQFSNCSMTSGLVLLSVLMNGKKITIIKDRVHYQNPGMWSIKRVALSCRAIGDMDFGISQDLKRKLLYVFNFPYRVVIHHWLLPHNHYDKDNYIERLYYGFYRYHLPFIEKLDYWIRMKLFSIDLVYKLHMAIYGLEHKLKQRGTK